MKTSKVKCREMWAWLGKNPDMDKENYEIYLKKEGREDEFHPCWACEEASKYPVINKSICYNCPIQWTDEKNLAVACLSEKSPYYSWRNYTWLSEFGRAKNKMLKKEIIKQILHKIDTTWIDAEHEEIDITKIDMKTIIVPTFFKCPECDGLSQIDVANTPKQRITCPNCNACFLFTKHENTYMLQGC